MTLKNNLFVCLVLLYIIGIFGAAHSRKVKKHFQTRQNGSVENSVTFTLYTTQNPNGVQLSNSDKSINDANIDFNKTTKFVTHGFIDSKINISYVDIKNAYILKYDYNVILVNWTDLSGPLNDTQATTNSGPVSQYYANFVNFLISKGGKENLFHLIGHGLGAHISGTVGAQVISSNKSKLARITALDPTLKYLRKLDSEDASFVDVIHTSVDVYGIQPAVGTLDFYPNNGQIPQPGCGGFFKETAACSHFGSVRFFRNSIINATRYLATRCDSYESYRDNRCSDKPTTYMGENATAAASSTYFTTTDKAEETFTRTKKHSFH